MNTNACTVLVLLIAVLTSCSSSDLPTVELSLYEEPVLSAEELMPLESLISGTVKEVRDAHRLSGGEEEPGVRDEFIGVVVEVDQLLLGREVPEEILIEFLAYQLEPASEQVRSARVSSSGLSPSVELMAGRRLVVLVAWSDEVDSYRLASTRLISSIEGQSLRPLGHETDMANFGLQTSADVDRLAAERGIGATGVDRGADPAGSGTGRG